MIVREPLLKPVEAGYGRNPKEGLSTLSVHAGEQRQKPMHSITDPIVCASTYTFRDTQAVIDYIEQNQTRGEYGRYGSPGEQVVEKKLAALEGAEQAILYASGMAALVGLLTAKLMLATKSFSLMSATTAADNFVATTCPGSVSSPVRSRRATTMPWNRLSIAEPGC